MRLHKYLAKAGVASLRKSEALIEAKRVKVNNQVITTQGVSVTSDDVVMVDDQIVTLEEFEYYMLYKPKNTISSVGDDRNRKDVVSLIKTNARIFPVGRLDKDTTGLLLLTNDGEFANKVMHPSNNISKYYKATIAGSISSTLIQQLEKGVLLDDGSYSDPARIEFVKKNKDNTTSIGICIHQGKNRIVRRMFEAINKPIVHLFRYQVGPLTLDGLSIGQYRTLTQKEIQQVTQSHKG